MSASSGITKTETEMDYRQSIINTANRLGVPPTIALSVAQQESGMRHYDAQGNVIRGQAGEIGMFQLMPLTALEMFVNPWDPEGNIEGGVGYLRKMFSMTGSWVGALEAYNGGIGNWKKGTVSQAARGYAQQVMARAPGMSLPSEIPGVVLPTTPTFPIPLPGDGGTTYQDPVFTVDATAQSPHSTALLLILGLLAVVAITS